MGLSVISLLSGGINPAKTLQNGPLAKGLVGDFAALLSGGLPGTEGLSAGLSKKILTVSTASNPQAKSHLVNDSGGPSAELLFDSEPLLVELSGKSPDSTKPEEDPRQSIEETLAGTASQLDPAMLAPLTGNPALPLAPPPCEAISFQVQTEKPEMRIAESKAGTGIILDQSAGRSSPVSATEGLGIFEKYMAAPQLGQSGAPGNEAASFAAETTITPETSNAAFAGSISTNSPTRQPHEASAADQSSINTHFHESSWSQQFGEKIVWLAKTNQQSAQININPPELGPVQITLNLSGDQAKVVFASPHAEVRQAIESALPQLKEMLSSAGINLGQTNVGANMAQQNPDNPYRTANGKRLPDENAILPANDKALSTNTSSVLQRGRGLVDLFA